MHASVVYICYKFCWPYCFCVVFWAYVRCKHLTNTLLHYILVLVDAEFELTVHTLTCSVVQAIVQCCCSVGLFVGEFPVLTIILTFIICGLCGIGLKTFSETEAQDQLWVPQSSRLINEKAWVDRVFPDETRFVAYVMESETDVLTPSFFGVVRHFCYRICCLLIKLYSYKTVLTPYPPLKNVGCKAEWYSHVVWYVRLLLVVLQLLVASCSWARV